MPKNPSVQELLADSGEPTAAVPLIVRVAPDEAQAPPGAAPVEARHVAVAARAHPVGAEGGDRELPLLFGVLGPEGEEFRQGRGAEVLEIEVVLDFLRRREAVEVDEVKLHVDRAGSHDREVLRRDVAVLPVVTTGGDHLCEGHGVIHMNPEHLLSLPFEVGVLEEALELLPRNPVGSNLIQQLTDLLDRDLHGHISHHLPAVAKTHFRAVRLHAFDTPEQANRGRGDSRPSVYPRKGRG